MLKSIRLTRIPILIFPAILLIAVPVSLVWRVRSVSAENSKNVAADAQKRQEEIKQALGRLPMNFEVNQGQVDAEVKFVARGHLYQVFLTESEAALVLENGLITEEKEKLREGMTPLGDSGGRQSKVLRFKTVGGASASQVEGLDLLRTKSNYLIGNDPQKWHTEIPNYARVEYKEVYPGINLAFYGSQTRLEYDFVVAPGADPSQITMSVEGAENIEVDANGDLILHVGGAKVYHRSPISYQQHNGAKRSVQSHYVLKGGNQIGFTVENYDATKSLVIDPIIDFSTFFGGIGSDEGFAIAVDTAGNAYVTGTTYSSNFNVFAPLQTTNRGGKYDAFVTKINPSGSGIIYSTYLGGGGEDAGRGIAVDSAGNAYIAGITNSQDFNTRNPLQPTITGLADDAFITKINADGSNLIFSTYFG